MTKPKRVKKVSNVVIKHADVTLYQCGFYDGLGRWDCNFPPKSCSMCGGKDSPNTDVVSK